MKKIKKQLKKYTKKLKSKTLAYLKHYSQKCESLLQKMEYLLFDSNHVKAVVMAGFMMLAIGSVAMERNYLNKLLSQGSNAQQKTTHEIEVEKLKRELQSLVKGYPIEKMVPYIAEKDRKTAAYIVGIAKKESNWGKRKPVLRGQDCYNYWGFRAKSVELGSDGHTCFENPKQAVEAVSKRISEIIKQNKVESARNMLVWKCGYSCASHDPFKVDKWARDVDLYAGKVLQ